VEKYFELRAAAESTRQALSKQHSVELSLKMADLTKKSESLLEQVQESGRILEEEIKLFRKNKEMELQNLMSAFVRI